jgi:ribosomal protein S12 methylthiotransferase accessory factor
LPPNFPRAILSPRLGIVEDYWNSPPFNDEPKFFHITAKLRLPSGIRKFLEQTEEESLASVGGCSLHKERALWKAAGEAVERKSLFPSKSLSRVFKAFRGFGQNEAVDPNDIAVGTERSCADRKGFNLEWIPGFRVATGEAVWIPSQLVYVPHIFRRGETIIRTPITTGAAFSSSLDGAVITGLCEVIERDAFMVAWLRQLQLTRIDLSRFKFSGETGRLLRETLKSCARYRLETDFYALPSDTTLRCILAVVQDESTIGPPFTLGARAHWDTYSAILGALEEANQLRPWLRRLRLNAENSPEHNHVQLPRSLEQRAVLSMSADSVRAVRSWLDASVANLLPCEDEGPPCRLLDLVKTIENLGYPVFAVDISATLPKILREQGFAVAKAIVPGYQPLYLTEALRDYAWKRLDSAESRLDSHSLINAGDIFDFPHPFL